MAKSANRSRRAANPTIEPRLGIFWLVKGSLLLDSVPLSESEQGSDYRDYPHSHINIWEQWQRIGKAPAESEYDEYPRGRITSNARANTFTLFADKCILDRKELINRIKKELHLPKQTSLDRDQHYRCSTCLYGAAGDED
ncbi:MAG TPA: hypothetical protein VGS27_11040 [Candidatus Sulfotelmatobacter sp.]|nr:hypothetical protein [Candidatus Sulfotelmatobacter sp.]